MNELSKSFKTGTAGELFVQLRLLQYGVQAAPPLKDTGNDLIAVRGSVFKAIQVKTTAGSPNDVNQNIERKYHILAIVALRGEGCNLNLNDSKIFLLEELNIRANGGRIRNLEDHELTPALVDRIFRNV